MPGGEGQTYLVHYLEAVVLQDIPALPRAAGEQIKRAIEHRLAHDPVAYGKPLRYSLQGHRRIRVGDYRVVYRIDLKERLVVIVAIKHRKYVYD